MNIAPADVTIQFFRASGPGGQHRNKTASAVRLKHRATGVVVEATEERCQHKNREVAFRRLEQRLRGLAEERRARLKAEAHKTKPKASFGASARTYRLIGPVGVTDNGAGHFEANVLAVLNGRIDGFLRASLLSRSGWSTPGSSSPPGSSTS